MSMGATRVLCATTVLLCLAAPVCHAQQWSVAALSTDSGATVSIDEDSVCVRKYIAKGWVRIDYQAPRDHDSVRLTGYAALWQANCQNHTYWASESTGFRDKNQEPVKLYNTEQQWQSPSPGGDEDVAMEALCAGTKSLYTRVRDKAGDWFHQYVEGDM